MTGIKWENDTRGGNEMKKLMAIAVATALTSTVVSGPAVDAATTVKLKNNKLVYAKTGKVVKGYKVYKKKLYKNGKLTTGRVKYGKGKNMKLYYNGSLAKGTYVTKDGKYLFVNGSLEKGKKTVYHLHLQEDNIYENGVRTHHIIIKDGKLYDNNKLKKGKYVILNYVWDREFLSLYIDGHLAKGLHKGKYGEDGKTYLFKDGEVATAFYKGKVYQFGLVAPANQYVYVDSMLYYNHEPYTGTYNGWDYSDDADLEMYENGKMIYRVTLKAYLDQLAIVQALDGEQAAWNEEVVKLMDILIKKTATIQDSYGRQLISENPPELDEEEAYPIEEYGQTQLLKELTDMKAQLQTMPHTEEAQQAVEKGFKAVYALQKLHYENGAFLDGAYEGNYYENGKLLGSQLNYNLAQQSSKFDTAFYEYRDAIADATDKEALTTTFIESLLQKVKAAEAIGLEHQHPIYPNAELSVPTAQWKMEESVDDYRYIENIVKMYQLSVDLTPLKQAMAQAGKALNMTVPLEAIDINATYKPLILNETQTGQFDDDGFAYFKVDLQDQEGVYEIAGDYRFETKYANVWVADDLEKLPTQVALAKKNNLYLEQGTQYIVVRGKAHDTYEFTMKQYQFNYDDKSAWKIQEGAPATIDLPYYKYENVRIPIEITNNNSVELFVGPRIYTANNGFKGIQNLTMTNNATGEVYPIKKIFYEQKQTARFLIDAPKGTYTLTYEQPENVYGEGALLTFSSYQPITLLNSKNLSNERSTFTLDKDTTVKFTLTKAATSGSNAFNLYNSDFQRIKQTSIDYSKTSKSFTYTLEKGKYYLNLDHMNMSVTAK